MNVKKKPVDLSRVVEIAKEVELRSVSCREVLGRRCLELSEMPTLVQWIGRQDPSGHRELDDNQIVVLIRFTAHAEAAGGEAPKRVAEVSATFALRYQLDTDRLQSLGPEDVQAFAETNGVYNAWPYWREVLQSTAARVGLPGVVAPVFRLVAKPTTVPDGAKS